MHFRMCSREMITAPSFAIAAFPAVWPCLGAMVPAHSVTNDFDKSVNFTGYRTHAWVPGRKVGAPLIDQRIVNALDAQLADKGFVKVESGAAADLLG